MEKTKLNLSLPLLSVRRINNGQSEGVSRKNIENSRSICVPKSDCDMSEGINTLAVPFCWEQVPGKRRCGVKDPSMEPRLRLGRKPNSTQVYSNHKNIPRSQTEIPQVKDHADLLDSLLESMYAKGEFDLERPDPDYTYSDELETLTESLSLNGCKGPAVDVTASGAMSVDSRTRDFMMSRFLPAAKAAVLDRPKFVKRNDHLVTEQHKLVKKKTIAVERKPMDKNYEPYFTDYADDESEHEVNDHHKRTHKFWKLFHRLRVKSPIGPKMRNQAPISSMDEAKRLSGNALNRSRKAYSGPLGKQPYDSMYQKRFHSGALSGELCKTDKRNISNKLFHSRSAAVSPTRNAIYDGTREVDNLKGGMVWKDDANFQDIPTQSVHKGGSDSPTNVVEKTVYVDSVNYVKTSGSLDLGKWSNPEEFKDISERTKGSKELAIVNRNRSTNRNNQENFKPDHQSCSGVTSSQSTYPPLPKSPSESWLWRTLPTIPLRNNIDQTSQSPMATNTAIKRDITGKSCNEHTSNAYYFEELVPHGSHLW